MTIFRGWSITFETTCIVIFFILRESLVNDIYTFSDLKLHLQSTDYGNFLANEPGPLSVGIIEQRLKEKLVNEFVHMRNQAVTPLSTFMDYVT